jgi:hypothetical protein
MSYRKNRAEEVIHAAKGSGLPYVAYYHKFGKAL